MIHEQPLFDNRTVNTKVWDSIYTHDDKPANLMFWFVWAPWMHSLWNWHIVALIHLRPIEGDDTPINFQFEGATHEVISFALDPDAPERTTCVIEKGEKLPLLTPANFCQQFVAENDAEAIDIVSKLMRKVGVAELSLDSDYAHVWEQLLRK